MLLMLVVVFVAPLASYLPKATRAVVFFLVAWGLTESKEAAVHAIFLKLQKSMRVRCERRIFRECQEVPTPR
jgi:MFS superfamily sulfate permease-like transporter